jgi:hypothetical protein
VKPTGVRRWKLTRTRGSSTRLPRCADPDSLADKADASVGVGVLMSADHQV